MKFAIIGDIHIGDYRTHKGIYRKATPHAEKLLKGFVRKMNKTFRPDFVVQGGDMIEDINLTTDKKNYKKGLVAFSTRPDLTFITNHREFLKIIAGKNVKLVFNGHLHWNKKKVLNGTHYITVQSLVENTSGKVEGPPANAFTLVNLEDNFAFVKVLGKGGLNYKIKI